MANIDDQNPNQPAIELSLDFAARSNNPAVLAGACIAHAGILLIPRDAANAIADIALRPTASLIERELVDEVAEFLRAVEKRFNEEPRRTDVQRGSNSRSEWSVRQNPVSPHALDADPGGSASCKSRTRSWLGPLDGLRSERTT